MFCQSTRIIRLRYKYLTNQVRAMGTHRTLPYIINLYENLAKLPFKEDKSILISLNLKHRVNPY